MDSTRALKRLLFVAVAFFGSVITLGVVTTPDDAPSRPATRPAVVAGFSHDQLQRDADMTQQMSAPSANTGSQAHRNDGQLDRSQSPGYVEALEQHQADIDRMLAQGTP
jgi:hypothetical protein